MDTDVFVTVQIRISRCIGTDIPDWREEVRAMIAEDHRFESLCNWPEDYTIMSIDRGTWQLTSPPVSAAPPPSP